MLPDKELADWLRDHEMYLYAVARGVFRDTNYEPSYDDVREVVADAMYRLYIYRASFTPKPDHKDPLKAWASLVVRRVCWSFLQNLTRKPEPIPLDYDAHITGPEPTYIQRETARRYLSYLSAIQQTAVLMQFQGYDYDEIARHLNVTWADVKSILSSARRKAWRREAKEDANRISSQDL